MIWQDVPENMAPMQAINMVCDALIELYDQLEELLKQKSLPEPACKPGCSYCCNLLCLVLGTEALLIAREVMTWWDRDKIKIALVRAALECEPGVDRRAYRIAEHGCVFLRDGLCRIYKLRPSSCRWCIAVGSSKECADPDATISYLNVLPLQTMVCDYDQRVFDDLLCAPLPVAVLWALCGLDGSPEPDLDPSAWFRAHSILGGI